MQPLTETEQANLRRINDWMLGEIAVQYGGHAPDKIKKLSSMTANLIAGAADPSRASRSQITYDVIMQIHASYLDERRLPEDQRMSALDRGILTAIRYVAEAVVEPSIRQRLHLTEPLDEGGVQDRAALFVEFGNSAPLRDPERGGGRAP